jgi:dihydrofolate reductase
MARTILYMAISSDGFIAGEGDNLDWISDSSWKSYQEFVSSCDTILVGKNTFELMEHDEFILGPKYFVVTNDPFYTSEGVTAISIKSKEDMPEGQKIGVIGGGELIASLAKLGLIDEIILDIEPVKIDYGIKLFGDHEIPLKLEILGSKQLGEDEVQRHYKVIN